MLQSIRDRTQGWITSTVIGLLIIVFALWGIHGYLESNGEKKNKIVAKVAGQILLQSDFDKACQRNYQQAQDRLGKRFSNDEKTIDQIKKQTLYEWEKTQVLFQDALQSKYRISQTLIDSVLLQIPIFQSGGHFSVQKFYDVLHAINYTKLEFLSEIKKSLLINQVRQGIIQSAFSLPQEVNNYIKYTHQKRDFAYLIVPYSKFEHQKFLISDSKVLAYYQENKEKFSQPERASIEYIQLSLQGSNEKTFLDNKDKLANLTYTHSNSLAFAAKQLGLVIHTTTSFDKSGEGEGLNKNPKIIAATFSQDVLQGNNSSVININPNTAIVLRINKYQPTRIQDFNEVKGQIKAILGKQLAISETQRLGEKLIKNLEKNNAVPSNLDNRKLQWKFIWKVDRHNTKVNKNILNIAFLLTPPNKNISTSLTMKGFSLENGDYVLVRLIAVHDEKNEFPLRNSEKKAYYEEVTKDFGQLDYTLYTRNLLKKVRLVQ